MVEVDKVDPLLLRVKQRVEKRRDRPKLGTRRSEGVKI